MKLLHTSDWHLGRSLYGKNRYEEFEAFLSWLAEIIQQNGVDILLVAGDIFDTSTPGNRAQELYYRFLCKISSATCYCQVVIIAGNHDSPSFLNAPKELLRAMNIHVIGSMTESIYDEVIILKKDGQPKAIVCAVPYLRDKDIRTVEPGETIDDKNAKLIEGIKKHYNDVCKVAEDKQLELEKESHAPIPIVAMGHLFTAGSKTVDGDGVRELYVGSLAHVEKDVFPSTIDYLALGHLHIPQSVGGSERIRYSGSPIPIGFGEAAHGKKVIMIEFKNKTPVIIEIQVPCFQQLMRISGDLDDIQTKLQELKDENSQAWIEVEYTGSEIIGNLRETIEETLTGSSIEILRIKTKPVIERTIIGINENETLDDLDANDVFDRCLDTYEISADEREELKVSYDEIIKSLQEEDTNAE
ncbi:MAG TPA: exonuclease sbcCD subunit D [Lentisphaeria bacterium]|nr:MAG: exonuclease sbcCD subunit D [Lentisphaerae bacterium GWF2_38_69]HBM17278.1 exonuclease sbcCD subunit D [Lentisphaeria bacterium]